MRRGLPILLVLALGGCAHDQRAGRDEPRLLVESFRLEGVQALDPDAIKAGLVTRATGPWPWSKRYYLDRLALEVDLRRIETYYRLQGYYGARVTRAVVERLGDDRARVVVTVEEGEPTRISAVEIEGLDELPADRRDRATADLPVRPAEIFRVEQYETARDLVLARLRESGHARAEVEGRVEVDPQAREARVVLTARPGPLFFFGPIETEGLHIVPEDKVEVAARRALPVGARYSPGALEDAQAFVFDLGALQTVRVVLADDQPDPGAAVVRVVAQERPANALTLGGGLAIERGLQAVELNAAWRNIDLIGGASRLSWTNAVSLQLLPTITRIQRVGIAGESALELTVPQVWARTDLAGRVAYERVFRQAWSANAFTVQVGAPYRPRRLVSLLPALGFRQYFQVQPVPLAAPAPPAFSPDCPAPCRLAFPELEVTWDRRDDPITPRRGFLVLGSAQYAAPLLGSAYQFLRLVPEVRGYTPMGRVVLAGRLRLGAIWPLGATAFAPTVARLYDGGEAGHRGFGPERLSPMLETADGQFVPVGGNGMWLATLELRWRFLESWGLVVFADWGDVTEDPLDFSLQAPLALGVGGRYYTLAGPIRLDLAWRVPQRPRFALNTGAPVETRALDYFALSLSIGEAF